MRIKKIVQELVRQYKTNNPFTLAEALGYQILECPLGSIYGIYKIIDGRKCIIINSCLEYHEKLVVCAHELAHGELHPYENCFFLKNYTLFSIEKKEVEANKFCAYLLLTDEMLREYDGCTCSYISRCTYIPLEIVKLRSYEI